MEGLKTKADEIEQLENEINQLNEKSDKLKPTVLEFESIRKERNELKSVLRKMRTSYNSFVEFLRSIDEHYLDVKFPLFTGHQAENIREQIENTPEPAVETSEGTNG